MIVDDNPKFLRELKESLELYGYQIICLQDGKFVLGTTLEQKPDLILIDLKMEGMSGLEIADILSHSSQTYYIPIIIMSAYWTSENMKTALELYIRRIAHLQHLNSITRDIQLVSHCLHIKR